MFRDFFLLFLNCYNYYYYFNNNTGLIISEVNEISSILKESYVRNHSVVYLKNLLEQFVNQT